MNMMRLAGLPLEQGRPSEGFGLLLVGLVLVAVVFWIVARNVKDTL
jgi:hypothetical protein